MTEATSALAASAIKRWWAEVGTAGSSEEREILAKHLLASGKLPRILALLKLAAADPRVSLPPDAFDRDPYLLTVANGTLDLRTGKLREHRREDLISKRSPVAYDPAAECPEFEAFLELIFQGDRELIEFIQRAAGYSLTGDVGEQCLFFLYGTGRNGKSTLLNVLHAVIGEHGRVAAPNLLMATRYEAHPTELADLRGCRFASAVETEQGRQLAEVKIKWMTGCDKLKARFLHHDFFEFDPTHKFFLAGNYRPRIGGTDTAIWRRIHLIPFLVDIAAELDGRVVANFERRLEAEYPGILAWAVRGCLAWQQGGLQPPAVVVQATDEYRREQDVVAHWVEERCDRSDPCARTSARELLAAYQAETKDHTMAAHQFGAELTRLGVRVSKIGGVRFRLGIRLRGNDSSNNAMGYGDE